MSKFYVVSARKPDSVSHAIKASFTGPDDINLIVGKATHFEVYVLVDDDNDPNEKTLRLLLDVPVYGRISTLQTYRPQDRNTDFLFISTERYKFFVLSFNATTHQLVTEANGDIADRTGRPIDIGHIGVHDPDGRMIGLHLYQGLFKVIPLNSAGGRRGSGHSKKHARERNVELSAINLRLEELAIISLEFMQSPPGAENKPMLAVLHQDTKGYRHLKTYVVDVAARDLKEYSDLPQANLEAAANLIIPIPRAMGGGVIVVGEQTIACITQNGVITIPIQPTVMKCWNMIDPEGTRYLLGDYLGNLYALVLFGQNGVIKEMSLETLGKISQPSSIVYLDSGYVYIGSQFGDSQLILLSSERNERREYLTVQTEFENLSPITDFCVVDIEKQGQGQMVACCGGYKDGSLRVIRNGIGIEVLGTLNDVPELTGIWALRPTFDTDLDDTLVMSFISETRLQKRDEEGDLCPVEEVDAGGFRMQETTLACANMLGDGIVQVTPNAVILLDARSRAEVAIWRPFDGSRINHASLNPRQILVALSEGRLVYIELRGRELVESCRATMEHEISCLNIASLDPQVSNVSSVCLIGMWTDMSVRVLELSTLKERDKVLLGTETIPRSVLLVTMQDVQYALAALGDGQLFTFIVDPETGCLRDRKKISLGSQPITLSQFQSKGQRHVFAASDRPTVIHTSNGKLIYSNVNLKEVTHMCPFNYEDEALALVTEGSLKVGTVEAIEKLHIKKIPLGETARRITHQEKSGTFGVLTLRIVQNEETGDEEETGYLKLLDDQSFEVLDQFAMDTFENVQSIVSTEFTGDQKTYYCVGTAYVLPQEDEPSKGRILVFDVTEERRLRLVHEQETRGCVYCMASLGGKLLAGINSKAQLFKWEVADDGITMSLVERATHHGHILVLTIAVRGDFVLIGDLMKSVSVLSYNAGDDSLELIARDPDANWMTAVEALDDDVYIGAEDHSNLFALRRRSEAQVEEDRRRLESFGWFHLGEQVNRLRHGSLVMSLPDNEAVATPVLLYCTVNGGIGVVATLDDSTFRLLLDVQDNLRRIVKGVGGLAYTEWRRFENRRRTMNAESFLDGDLIESYLDLTREQQQAVVDGMRLPRDGHRDGHGMKKLDIKVEELTRMVEELTRIH